MLNFTLSAHAQVVMAERAISFEWVERVLRNPERTHDDQRDPCLRHALGRIPERND